MRIVLNKDTMQIEKEQDVVPFRNRVKEYATKIGLSLVNQTKLITAASELPGEDNGIRLVFEDKGPGINDIPPGHERWLFYGKSLGIGLPGTKRLVNEFDIKTEDRSYFAILKKEIHALAIAGNFQERKIGEIDIVVAETVSNLVKHAGGGQLLVKLIEEEGIQGIELISIDNGPGITDVSRMVADGISTKNTLGHGLGAMKRLSDVFQVYSQKEWGTVILIRIFNEELPAFRKPSKIDVRAVLVPKPGEEACGDGFFHIITSQYVKLFLGDGLGHGPEAERAVLLAGESFTKCESESPVEIIRSIDAQVKKTRGLVGTVAVFDIKARKWKICGIGNISTKIYSGGNAKNYTSYNGIIGLNVPNTLNEQETDYEKGQQIIMCSDGIKSRWEMLKFPSILRRLQNKSVSMHEIAKVTLENEMDLILAHKRTMKLAELAGLSLSAQTTFATAVSEVSRSIIESKNNGALVLCVESGQSEQYIVACLKDNLSAGERSREGLEYAKKLVNKYHISSKGKETSIDLYYYIAPSFRIDIYKLDEWRHLFRNEPPVSPYEELKRKNEQLQELSEKVQKSEGQYKTLTNSLPLIIFSLDLQGQLLYANEWLLQYTGQTIEALNERMWKMVVHEDDYDSFSLLLRNDITKGTTVIKTQSRLRNNQTGDYLWHQVSLSPFKSDNGELQYWIGYIVDIHAQKVFEDTLKDNIELKHAQAQLEENQYTLKKTIEELNRSNLELQQFAFIASHDLQEPVRKLLFYSDYLLNKYVNTFDTKGANFLANMQSSALRMRNLIQDLLSFSQINKEEVNYKRTDLNSVATIARQDLEMIIDEKKASLQVASLPVINGDERMMRQLFENIIGNSLKYCRTDVLPVITITSRQENGQHEIAFRDNGIGFDEKYLPQMFNLFQRLHSREMYDGTGLGLAICRKIVELHQGRIWAEAKEGEGATFYISLPDGLN
ncbi:hypothetical protein F5148DRAFT_1295370 [Russula earlei]|uniref:Uncharacterized protein n=1 Tax=Russula earlei TaxID=71964 RepID=A0ACC0TRR3_9AGAM|nr:hypothetical protein F5148DRAFT_1295370 [Russula earlei]